MEILRTIAYLVMLFSALAIIVLVLLQHGKGADMGTGFGAGASGSLFGASGSANFLSRSTAVAAVLFFAATLALGHFASHRPAAAAAPDDKFVPVQALPATPAPAPAGSGVPGDNNSGAAGQARVPAAAPVSAVPPAAPAKSNEVPK
jgi:preprotein translocase subunit SecG